MYESVKNNHLDALASGLVSRNTIVLMLMLQMILMAANDSKFYKGLLLEIQIMFKLFILYLRNDHNESICYRGDFHDIVGTSIWKWDSNAKVPKI